MRYAATACRCDHCGTRFCARCLCALGTAAHDCATFQGTQAALTNADAASRQHIVDSSQPCPNCR
jgi:hypothetical protein